MPKKYFKITLSLVLIVLAVGLFLFFSASTSPFRIITEIKNLKTGELIDSKDYIESGLVLQRRTLVQNTSSEELKDYKFKDKNPLTGEKKEYIINLKPGESTVLEEILPIQTKEKGVQEAVEQTTRYTLTSVKPTQINNNFDTFFEVAGENMDLLNQVIFKCDDLEYPLSFSTRSKEALRFNLPAFALKQGDCNLFVTTGTQTYPTEFILKVQQDQDPQGEIFLKSIVPNQGTTHKDSLFILTGRGFNNVVAIQIDNGVVLDLEFMEQISDTTMVVNIPAGLNEGDYFFRFLGKKAVQSYPNLLFNLSNEE